MPFVFLYSWSIESCSPQEPPSRTVAGPLVEAEDLENCPEDKRYCCCARLAFRVEGLEKVNTAACLPDTHETYQDIRSVGVGEIHNHHNRRSAVEEDCCIRRVLLVVRVGHSPDCSPEKGRVVASVTEEERAAANATEEDIRLERSLEEGKVVIVVEDSHNHRRRRRRVAARRSRLGLGSRTLQQTELMTKQKAPT